MQNVILFDLGGVIINWNDDWLYDEITSQLKQPFEKIKSKYNANLCSLFESKINESEFWDLVLEKNNIIDKKIISKTFSKMSSINYDLLNFAKSLKNDGHTIGILSNLTPETSMCIDKNQFKDFDYHFYSNSLRMSKPNPEIYQYVCEQIDSKKILFVDDKQENLDAAKLFHIDTILFTPGDSSDDLIENQINAFVN
ncbi:HAD-IA family hydrolase [Nitrosopumilus sp.]|jgi:HAD superfamily hydrolase (TIGR01509 family)|nr:HAD-IA family hydrolase [bacterium]MDC3292029.1 HAD-IA family hydrolase [Nitrosopumilus sp.]MDO7697865.1 HAD-IA family hydrolase [Nitrosopumilus sp.]|tara:strand:+ start:444 stop:1034 length:591 start_codon:yes stop_codon:yes gene_type:complete